jgi:hypothetical protein
LTIGMELTLSPRRTTASIPLPNPH